MHSLATAADKVNEPYRLKVITRKHRPHLQQQKISGYLDQIMGLLSE